MRPLPQLILLTTQGLGVAAVSRSLPLDHTWANHQKCLDIGGPRTFQPEQQPSLIVNFATGGEGLVSIVAFELGDEHLGGIRAPGSSKKEVLCNKHNIHGGLCSESQLGEFLISDTARHRARYPFITRAVNLSSPVSLHYPVTGPGLYCVAAVGFTAKAFSATMLAIDPIHGSLPAFRVGELTLYQYLGPSWILLAIAWALRSFETSSPLSWLVPLSVLRVALRWGGLELGVRGGNAAVVLRVLGYAAEATLCSGVLLHTHRIATAGHQRDSKSWFVRVSLVVFVALSVATSVADFTATATSRALACSNVLLGAFLVPYIAICSVRLLRHRQPAYENKMQANIVPNPHIKVFAGFLGLLCLCCAVIAAGNTWIATRPLPPLEFGQRFWRIRFWAMQTPFEFIFLFWTACTVLYCRYQGVSTPRSAADVEELRKLGDGGESDGPEY